MEGGEDLLPIIRFSSAPIFDYSPILHTIVGVIFPKDPLFGLLPVRTLSMLWKYAD